MRANPCYPAGSDTPDAPWNYVEPQHYEHCDNCGTAFDYTISVDDNGHEVEEFVVPVSLPSGEYCSDRCARRN